MSSRSSAYAAVLLSLALAALRIAAASPAPEPAPTAEDILARAFEKHRKIQSYSFVDYKMGYDTFVKEKEKEVRADAERSVPGSLKDRLEKEAGEESVLDDTDPSLKKGKNVYKFMKPFLCQLEVLESDFVPAMLIRTRQTYRPDKNPDVYYLKLRFSPVAVRRDIHNAEASSLINSSWAVNLILMDYYRLNGTMKFEGERKFHDREAYVISFGFGKNLVPAPYEPDLEKWGVPNALGFRVKEAVGVLEKEKFSRVDFWIDERDSVIVRRDEFIGGRFHWRDEFHDIKLNHLTEKDF
ncbi:MAG: hypothetical protein AB1742_11885 [bacterium]